MFDRPHFESLDAFELDVKAFVAESGNPNSFAAWRAGWGVAMTLQGYPACNLEYVFETLDDERRITYTWTWDQDELNKAFLQGGEVPSNHEAWVAAHVAFLIVEPMRPRYIEASPALQQFIDDLKRESAGDN